MILINCSCFTELRKGRVQDGIKSICVLDASNLPGGLRVLVSINDQEKFELRRILKTVPEVLDAVKPCLSMAVRNDSLVDWKIGVKGRSVCQQVWFQSEGGAELEFSEAGEVPVGVKNGDGGLSNNCSELSVPLDVDTMDQSFQSRTGIVSGSVEVMQFGKFFSAEFCLEL